jgi:NADH:ubiquinone oxidoreductase subunit E
LNIEELRKKAEQFVLASAHPQAALIPLIAILMDMEGDVSEPEVSALSQICAISVEQVQERLLELRCQRRPGPAFKVCGDLICVLHGAKEIFNYLAASTSGGVQVDLISCPGHCYAAPVVETEDGRICRAALDSVAAPAAV